MHDPRPTGRPRTIVRPRESPGGALRRQQRLGAIDRATTSGETGGGNRTVLAATRPRFRRSTDVG